MAAAADAGAATAAGAAAGYLVAVATSPAVGRPSSCYANGLTPLQAAQRRLAFAITQHAAAAAAAASAAAAVAEATTVDDVVESIATWIVAAEVEALLLSGHQVTIEQNPCLPLVQAGAFVQLVQSACHAAGSLAWIASTAPHTV